MTVNNAINSKQGLSPTDSPTFASLSLTSPLIGTYGGTGINNGTNTLTYAGNVAFSGAFSSTFTLTGPTTVTFPTSGTLATSSGSVPSIQGTANEVLVNGTSGSPVSGTAITLTTSQPIATTSSPTFALINIVGASPNLNLSNTTATSGQTTSFIPFAGIDSSSLTVTYGDIRCDIVSNTHGSTTGKLVLSPDQSGLLTDYVAIDGSTQSCNFFKPTTNTAQPAFYAYLNNSVTSVTGDGTRYTIIFNATTFDQANNFNTSTGTFTAPKTGIYQFNYTIKMSNLSASYTIAYSQLTVSGTSAAAYQLFDVNAANCRDANNSLALSGSITVKMTSTDTATIFIAVVNGTKTVNIVGETIASLDGEQSSFSGFLVA